MAELTPPDKEFLKELHATIAANMANELFGVSELADAMHMSRSNLLRKVKRTSGLSVSQVISQARLQRSMELLRTGSLTVSEVAAQVGFSSASYFIKCFREFYGYPPGEAAKQPTASEPLPIESQLRKNKTIAVLVGAIGLISLLLAGWWLYSRWATPSSSSLEKTIVVLPFKNESNDSSNVYLINGLVESTLNNLQKIANLKLISRTSAEKYRYAPKSIPEMARELNANYFVEGSGQKMGDRVVLTVQLIDATDRQLWSRQYRREVKDIFSLQQEIAKDIADEVQVIVTPDERARIEKNPTQSPEAYDAFLKGVDLLYKNGNVNLEKSLRYFNEAITHDNTFGMAYACAGIACYYLDSYQTEKKHLKALEAYAENAMRCDSKLAEAFVAKAMYYLLQKEYSQALPYLEKGLELQPNSTYIIGLLADFYTMHLPNTGKYLEYALKGLRLGATSGDSSEVSYYHLRLANALIQTGFVDKSLEHVNRALEYNRANPFALYLRAFILYAKNGDLRQTRKLLVKEFNKDTTRFDILQDIGKVSYYLSDFDSAYICYKRFNRFRQTQQLDVFVHENFHIGLAYEKVGEKAKAKEFFESYKRYLDTDQTIYKNLGLGIYYSRMGEKQKALNHLKLFTKEDNIQYWPVLFLNKSPLPTSQENSPEFKKIFAEIEQKFWATHNELKLRLEEKGVM